jgi:hypothetical protein
LQLSIGKDQAIFFLQENTKFIGIRSVSAEKIAKNTLKLIANEIRPLFATSSDSKKIKVFRSAQNLYHVNLH